MEQGDASTSVAYLMTRKECVDERRCHDRSLIAIFVLRIRRRPLPLQGFLLPFQRQIAIRDGASIASPCGLNSSFQRMRNPLRYGS